jgi:heme/copper-type cytochrome/quinol oxidase subunit 2
MWLVQKGREWNYRSTDRPQEIRVKRGEWVTLRLTSIDVTHIFAIPDLGVQEVVEAGKVTQIPFRAEREGIFPFECRAWCRPGHNEMTGQLIVLPP